MKTLDGNKLQLVDSPLWIVLLASKTVLTGLYLFNPSDIVLTYVISVLMSSQKLLTIATGELKPNESVQLFQEDDTITLKYGETLKGRCDEMTDTITWTLFGESAPLMS